MFSSLIITAYLTGTSFETSYY